MAHPRLESKFTVSRDCAFKVSGKWQYVPRKETQEMGKGETGEGSDVCTIVQKEKPRAKGKSVPFRDKKHVRGGCIAMKGHAGDTVQWSLYVRERG